ncbi:hypothetical protein EAO71_05930 [Streptomyces sp. ms191]|uniref:hypothetical protein n=1 Tax=unclassified Streptomyces TaxID=2593676 RepID=UPI0011CDF63F|nr:hypothetical protein [Streptomyces sp. ms191]TXS31683.1 hypothetical protein EAO71_05930 [Streptomyces sp. ms191]
MGKWIVVAQYGKGETYFTEVLRRLTGTRDEALEALRAATLTYGAPMREKWREVYRFPGGDSYLVIVKGAVSLTEYRIGIAEKVWDSNDPAVAKAVDASEGTYQDTPPAG